MTRIAAALAATVAAAACGLLGPTEHWCAKTSYWSLTDSVVATDSVGTWYAAASEPDSAVVDWSVNGECSQPQEAW